MTHTQDLIDSVKGATSAHGHRDIIGLWGVPGTGKSYVAERAAQELSGHPLFVHVIQFHQGYTYEDFIEGLRPSGTGFAPKSGDFLDFNAQALADTKSLYVLVIEEFTRANIAAVLGELLTFLEYRGRTFVLPVSRQRISIAPNLRVIATMNPRDRSAIELDDALLRRMRIIECPPDIEQLDEMLKSSLDGGGKAPGEPELIDSLKDLFVKTSQAHAETFKDEMPFGHGAFAGVRNHEDVVALWHQRIKHILRRPLMGAHPYAETIEANYPFESPVAAPSP